jgi:argininosuccinate lyase
MTGNESDVVRRDRFSGGPARSFLSSMAADERLFAADLAVSRAHVVMLAEQRVVDEADAGDILGALDAIEGAGFEALPDAEDVHAAIETAVIEGVAGSDTADGPNADAFDGIGDAGGRMHTARSRNDEVATCIRYRLREDLLEAMEATMVLREVLLSRASHHTATVMPGYTHRQPAQPTTVAHYLVSYEQAVARDSARLLDSYSRVNRSPLGAAALAGTPFDVDRERTAALLGFDGLVENAMDAVSARDFAVETLSALATHATHLSGLCEDGVEFASDGLLELDDDYASTSSIMPQKKNPDTLELARARSGDATAALNGLLTTLKSLPRAYNRDLQRATPHVWHAVDSVTGATEVVAGAMETATWNESTLLEAAGEGFATATGVADLLAEHGVPFRDAHAVVAAASESVAAGEEPITALDAAGEETLERPVSSIVGESALAEALDPLGSVASRNSLGGPAPTVVEESIEEREQILAADRETVGEHRDALVAADRALETEVSQYA